MQSEQSSQLMDKSGRLARFDPWLSILSLLSCLAAFGYHFYILRKYSVNIPYYDDWAMFNGRQPASLDWYWLYQQANDHRTTTTKLLVWFQFQLNGWDLRTHLVLSFLVYAASIAAFAFFIRRVSPDLPRWVILGFVLFFSTPLIWTDFAIGYAVAIHLWMLFTLLTAYCLFEESQIWRVLSLACLAATFAIYSFAAGIATSIVLVGGFSLFKLQRAYFAKDKDARRRELLQLAMVLGVTGIALFVWFIGWKTTPQRLPWVLPYDRRFWSFFLNLVAFAFGIDRVSSRWGLICLLIVAVPICLLIVKQKANLTMAQWASIALVAALLADLALISIGRAEYGILTAKYPHYAQHGMPLILLSVVNWGFVLARRHKLKGLVIAGLWLGCLATFAGNWSFGIYQKLYAEKLEGRECVRSYYEKGFERTGVDARCPTIFPWPASQVHILENAKRVKTSFYREMTEEK